MNKPAEKQELQTAEDRRKVTAPPAQTGGLSPMVQAVMSGQMTPDQLQQLLDVQRNYEKNEAEKAFHMAVAEFKKNPPKVIKDKKNTQFDSKYTSKGNLVNTVNAAMSPFGLNASWTFEQRDNRDVGVTCTLSHAQGHSKSVTLWAPPDKSGSKNPIQEIKSTITYLEIATYEAVTGISASDDGDDDGNGAGKHSISDQQAADLECLIDEVLGEDTAGFHTWLRTTLKAKTISELNQNGFDRAVAALEKRRKEGAKK